jgi:hypothetical protein
MAAHEIARPNESVGHAETSDQTLFVHALGVTPPAHQRQSAQRANTAVASGNRAAGLTR